MDAFSGRQGSGVVGVYLGRVVAVTAHWQKQTVMNQGQSKEAAAAQLTQRSHLYQHSVSSEARKPQESPKTAARLDLMVHRVRLSVSLLLLLCIQPADSTVSTDPGTAIQPQLV